MVLFITAHTPLFRPPWDSSDWELRRGRPMGVPTFPETPTRGTHGGFSMSFGLPSY
ncbi:hypothetical protein Sjap_012069 [Stephania japonica]|uniref:Uncharacterized protein n=1 Tax=Stephania japonica TaxID=461633 RepID=A0AAP0JEQ4_9MAGN